MEIILRDYQEECVTKVLGAYEQDKSGNALLVLPTGSGKTVIFCQIINQLALKHNINALIIAHRDELLDQAADKYRMVKPTAIIGKVGGGIHEWGGEVTVASIATISRPNHLKSLKAIGYGIIIIDEAHHAAADGYQRVLETLPNAFVLKVTATPDRLDKKEIDGGKPALYEASIIDMIERGYLCDVKAIAIRTDVNLDDLHTQMGDYNEKELETAIDTPARNQRVVDAYKEHCPERRAICFGVTVNHAWNLAAAFRAGGIPAGTVTGDTPSEERKKLYTALHDGEIKVLCNVQVLTEGFDEPLVDCVIMARPTQSRALYVQCIGRGLRLAPTKQNCVILDLTDNCFKHRLEPQNLSKAIGFKMRDNETLLDAQEREKEEKATAHKEQVRKLTEKRVEDININLLERLMWQQKDNGMFVLEVGAEKHRIALVPDENGLYSVWARLAPFYEGQCWLTPSPLDWAQAHAEQKARKLLADTKNVKLIDRNAPWRNDGATEKQLDALAKWQKRFKLVYDPLTITRGQAADLLDPVYERLAQLRTQRKAKGILV